MLTTQQAQDAHALHAGLNRSGTGTRVGDAARLLRYLPDRDVTPPATDKPDVISGRVAELGLKVAACVVTSGLLFGLVVIIESLFGWNIDKSATFTVTLLIGAMVVDFGERNPRVRRILRVVYVMVDLVRGVVFPLITFAAIGVVLLNQDVLSGESLSPWWVSASRVAVVPCSLALLLSWWWRGFNGKHSAKRAEILSQALGASSAVGSARDDQELKDSIEEVLVCIKNLVLESPWRKLQAKIVVGMRRFRSITVTFYVKTGRWADSSQYGIRVYDMVARFDEREDVQNACRVIIEKYRPATFDPDWDRRALEKCAGAGSKRSRVACYRRQHGREQRVSTVGASLFYGRAFYAVSPSNCRTVDSGFVSRLLGQEHKNVDRFVGTKSLFTVPVCVERNGESHPVAVIGVSRPCKHGLSLQDRFLVAGISRALEKNIDVYARRRKVQEWM